MVYARTCRLHLWQIHVCFAISTLPFSFSLLNLVSVLGDLRMMSLIVGTRARCCELESLKEREF